MAGTGARAIFKKENGVRLGRPRSTPDDMVARFCGSRRGLFRNRRLTSEIR